MSWAFITDTICLPLCNILTLTHLSVYLTCMIWLNWKTCMQMFFPTNFFQRHGFDTSYIPTRYLSNWCSHSLFFTSGSVKKNVVIFTNLLLIFYYFHYWSSLPMYNVDLVTCNNSGIIFCCCFSFYIHLLFVVLWFQQFS